MSALTSTPESNAAAASCDREPERAGSTPACLFASLWADSPVDTYISRSMLLRQFPIGKGFGDTVWLHEPPSDPVCYFRVTPARFAGLIERLKKRREALAKSQSSETVMTPEQEARAAELARVIERDTEVLRLLKKEYQARWPEAVKTIGSVVPEDIEEPARPSDAWRVERELETRTVASAPPLSDAEAELVAWASGATVPGAAFCPTTYSVVLGGAEWLARLIGRARSDALIARNDALERLKVLRAVQPVRATTEAESAARELALRS